MKDRQVVVQDAAEIRCAGPLKSPSLMPITVVTASTGISNPCS